jgi:signal peptidase II|tara:strand:+ start:195 stop:695 length:501 start_codon:yes stop_codon:yes gene_type:complete
MLKLNYKKKIIYLVLVITIFFLDRISKIYIINLAEINDLVDIYITSFLNLYLIWNNGIAFGLLSLDQSFLYNLVTLIIVCINILILVMIYNYSDQRSFFLIMVLGGSLGNLFDRLYYKAVPDFIDIHYGDFHWFVFNVADIFITIGVLCLILNEMFINKDIKNENK